MIKNVVAFSHFLMEETVVKGDLVVDGTCGNGNDTLMLAKLVGETGHVLSFDIQEQAIRNTKSLLQQLHSHHVTLIQDSHSNMEAYFPIHWMNNIGGAIFNLGYLPKGNHQIVTRGETTIKAIKTLLKHLKRKRLIVVVVYYGHKGGKEEKDQLMAFLQELDQQKYQVLQYRFINQKNDPPFLIAIEKR